MYLHASNEKQPQIPNFKVALPFYSHTKFLHMQVFYLFTVLLTANKLFYSLRNGIAPSVQE